MYRKPVVFITGIDHGKAGNLQELPEIIFFEKEFEVVDHAFSMQEIFSWLNKNYDGTTYGELHIVAKYNPWEGLDFETLIKSSNVTSERLRKAITFGKSYQPLRRELKRRLKLYFTPRGWK